MRSSKKLMARVRPGVELVLASLVPTSELITLDLPTFERPRKAISGRLGEGKWATSLAESRNREKTRTCQFRGSAPKLQVDGFCPKHYKSVGGSFHALFGCICGACRFNVFCPIRKQQQYDQYLWRRRSQGRARPRLRAARSGEPQQ